MLNLSNVPLNLLSSNSCKLSDCHTLLKCIKTITFRGGSTYGPNRHRPPFWQKNHANSAYFRLFLGYFRVISAIRPPVWISVPLFTYPGSAPAICSNLKSNLINGRNKTIESKLPFLWPIEHSWKKKFAGLVGPIHSQIFVIMHNQATQKQHLLLGCSCDNSHSSVWGASVMHHMLPSD